MNEKYQAFIELVDEKFRDYVNDINEYLTENGCKCEIKDSKSGYVVSYILNSTKKTLANFVFRKTGVKIRIYAVNIDKYQDFLNTLPDMAFMPVLNDENNSYIKEFLSKELSYAK